MKKYILIFSLILLSCSVIYSQSNTEIDKRLQKFYKQFASLRFLEKVMPPFPEKKE